MDNRVTDPQARRAALIRLGLAGLVIYTAPTITRLDQTKAAVPSFHCPPGANCGSPKK